MVKDVPGVRYTVHEGDDENWIPVTRKQRGRKRSSDSESSSGDLDVMDAMEVKYCEDDNTPGVCMRRGRVKSWIPIAPSPISQRTRSKINK